MASYVLRRRTWYQLMLDMDSALKLPDSILAEDLWRMRASATIASYW